MNSLPITAEPINLGVRFQVTVRGLEAFSRLADELAAFRADARQLGFEEYGPWDEMLAWLSTMPGRVLGNLETANRVVGLMFLEDLRSAWNTQAFAAQWLPLSAEYLAWKIAHRLDRRTLIATQQALESLGAQLPGPLAVEVGITAVAEDGTPYMVVQEFGSRDGKIPPRPLVQPALEANLDRYAEVYVGAVARALNNRSMPVKVGP
jgi:hypothetical protein